MNTYDWYKNTYLETHLKLVEQSISLAQTEFQTRVQMLQFYEKQLDNLRQGKGVSGTGASREAVGKFNAKALETRDIRLKQQASRDFETADTIQPMADLMSAGGDQGDVLLKIGQEQGFNVKGETQLERVRMAQQLVGAGNKAARKAGKKPDARKLESAAMTLARIDGPEGKKLMRMTEAELIAAEEKKTPVFTATGSTTRDARAAQPGAGSVNLSFNINDVVEDVDESGVRRKGLLVPDPENEGEFLFQPLTIEQERIFNLENRVNRLRSQIDDTYGQDIDIEKIIERGRDIYSRQYSPQGRRPTQEESRASLLAEIETMDRERGTNYGGMYTAYSSVQGNDSRIKGIRGGKTDDKISEVAETIYQMKRNGQEGRANDIALKLLGGDQDKANQAVGLAIHALIADESGKRIPNKGFKEKLSETLDSFASRMSKEEKTEQPKEQTGPLFTQTKPEPAQPFKPFEDFVALKPARQAAALRQHAKSVGGERAFMEALEAANLPVGTKTEDIIKAIPIPPPPEAKPLPTFGEGASLEDMVGQITGVDPRAGIKSASTFEDPTSVGTVPVPIGTVLTYEGSKVGYKIKGYENGLPQYVYVGRDGKEAPGTKLTAGMLKDAEEMFQKYGK